MKKFIISALILIVSAFSTFAQDDGFYSGEDVKENKNKEKKDNRWIFGGDLGFSFGALTYIEISPLATYKFTDRLIAGPGIIYVYEKYKPYKIETSIFGVRTVGMYSVFKDLKESIGINLGDIILYGENQLINFETYTISGNNIEKGDRAWMDNLLVGGGIFQNIGNRGGGLMLLILFDVTQNKYSTYSNPIFKVGFLF